jgi:hypothetical protein
MTRADWKTYPPAFEFSTVGFPDNGPYGTIRHRYVQPGCCRPTRLSIKGISMFGIGSWEMVILGLICILPMAAGVVVLVVLMLKKNSASSASTGAVLIPCPDCGRKLSPQATTCPQCGRPLAAG